MKLTQRQAVLDAVAEFDRIGGPAFLAKYGFGEARDYFLLLNGRRYDSKAIAGVAYGLEHKKAGPLKASAFSGGEKAVRRTLLSLGFTVVGGSQPPDDVNPHQRERQRRSAGGTGAADSEVKTWIFQGNPEVFDIEGYLAQVKVARWVVRQNKDAIAAGDRVFFWVAGAGKKDRAGVIAAGYVMDLPSIRQDDPASIPYWLTAKPGEELRVDVRIERVADDKHRIRRDWLVKDPIVADMLILKQAAGTNFLLADHHAARLEALWSRTGENWTEAESVAGLWAYAHTRGKEISKNADSLVAEVALLTGRAVGGVYNKVMNFRSIDPTDNRKGLSGAGEEDRRTWSRFFDPAAQDLETLRLDAAFKKFWGTPDAIGATVSSTDVATPTGQAYERDARARRAIEQYAMKLAIEHYGAAGFKVEDTHTGNPFDLRCRKGTDEVRVEVKGTRSDGSSVLVTVGEVVNARAAEWRSDLFIVYGISLREESGHLVGGGGVRLLIEGWRPEDAHLVAQTYRYAVDRDKGKRLD